jgi:hypothetical protein
MLLVIACSIRHNTTTLIACSIRHNTTLIACSIRHNTILIACSIRHSITLIACSIHHNTTLIVCFICQHSHSNCLFYPPQLNITSFCLFSLVFLGMSPWFCFFFFRVDCVFLLCGRLCCIWSVPGYNVDSHCNQEQMRHTISRIFLEPTLQLTR